jgi:hypothetical protein
MKTLFYSCSVVGLLLAGCGQEQQKTPPPATNAAAAETPAAPYSGSPITAPVDYLAAVAKAKQFAEKKIDVAQIEKAVTFFHEAEDRFPKDMDELVQKHYLAAIPKAPYGMEIVYDPNTGTVKVVKK